MRPIPARYGQRKLWADDTLSHKDRFDTVQSLFPERESAHFLDPAGIGRQLPLAVVTKNQKMIHQQTAVAIESLHSGKNIRRPARAGKKCKTCAETPGIIAGLLPALENGVVSRSGWFFGVCLSLLLMSSGLLFYGGGRFRNF